MTEDNNQKVDRRMSTNYKVYPYRHIILVLFSTGAVVNNVSNYIYLPIQTTIQNAYGLNLALVSLFTNYISNITYVPGVMLANKLADKKGLKAAVLLGTFVTLLSWWISAGCKWNFVFLPIGQSLFGFGFPFFNMPQKLSADWYAPNERDLATSVFNVFYQLAGSIGALIPGFFVNSDDNGTHADEDLFRMLFYTSIVFTAMCIPVFIFFRSKPPTPPSAAAAAIDADVKIMDLVKQPNYFLLLIGTSITVASYLALVGSIQPLVNPYGVSQNAVSYMVTTGVISACFGSFIVGLYMSKKKKYKKAYLISSFGSTVILILMFIVVSNTGSSWMAGIMYTIYQFMLSASLPLSWEFLIEIAFPAGEAAAGSLMMTFAQFISSLVGMGVSLILNDQTPESADISFYILIGFQLLGGLLVMCVSEDLRRLRYEQGSLLKRRRKSSAKVHAASSGMKVPFVRRDIIFDDEDLDDDEQDSVPADEPAVN